MTEVKVTLKRSLIGIRKKQKEAVRCLGLRKINKSRTFKDTPALRGQIQVVKHLISVEEIASKTSKKEK
ncbi:MAG: 50S ribosomal protein L30 [Bdellovibrionales bacterium]|nr:50S ribosomal protein L30 [Bdellovibrionales bacterium]